MKTLHNLLQRQLGQLGLGTDQAPGAPVWREFLATVSAELAKSEDRFRSLTSLSSDWFWEQDAAFRFTSISGRFNVATGMSEAEHLGRTRWELPGVIPPEGGWTAHRLRLAAHATFHDLELKRCLADGSYRYSLVSGEPVFDEDGKFRGYRGVGRDITEQKAAQEKVNRLARFDTLTGLFNRSAFFDCFDHAVDRAAREHAQLAVLFIDLDRFKDVNDGLGHIIGDDVLKVMAQRLQRAVRSSDTLARLGGDEFVLLAENAASGAAIADVAQRVVATLAEPIKLQDQECRLGASVGIALYPVDGQDAPTLLKNADIAMYRAKASGRNGFAFFSQALDQPQKERMLLGASLHRALELDQLRLLYQPKTSVATGSMIGVEALIRWEHPERGLLLPESFIPFAEESGLILGFGRWVMRNACRQAIAWQSQGLPPFTVAINLSARQFNDPELASSIFGTLKETGLDPRLLELEITESVMVDQHERALATLSEIKATGVRVSIDDFGTGYSSLARLKKLPIDAVKIDRSFVGDIAIDPDDAAITTAIIAMAHSLRLRVVAEGVETHEQARFLRDRGCDEMQGYLFGRPVAAAEIASFARQAPRAPLALVSAAR
ncbi:MAG TPA: EAL domain-containing protein [Casimicrobiaceae bacterium]|nr:EAL domain-containing protein [Casimicrobiaceae bacterium]